MLYLACDWVIQPSVNYKYLAELIERLGCDLFIHPGQGKTEAGFTFFRLSMKVSSEKLMKEFIESVGQQIGMTKWQPATEQYHERGQKLAALLNPSKAIQSLMLTRWLDTSDDLGRENERLRQSLNSER
jgi:hypothetical protein